MTPLLHEMLQEMRMHLSDDDIRAGLPVVELPKTDISLLYVDWSALCRNETRQLERIADLDADIQRMEPWGDYPMARVDQLAQCGQRLLFWRCRKRQYEIHQQMWVDAYQAESVSERDGWIYFTTITPQGANIVIPDAIQEDVTPSPVSTLIMLQTRAQDSLRQIRLEMGDFSLQHYREIEAALDLQDTLQLPSRRRRLLRKVRNVFGKRRN